MVKFVKKRDGSIVPFEKQKIINAIGKAGFVKEGIKEKIADESCIKNKKDFRKRIYKI